MLTAGATGAAAYSDGGGHDDERPDGGENPDLLSLSDGPTLQDNTDPGGGGGTCFISPADNAYPGGGGC